MDAPNKTPQDSSQSTRAHEKSSRVAIIESVQTPLGFFVLVVLIVEAIFGITANFSTGNDKTYLIAGMTPTLMIVDICVQYWLEQKHTTQSVHMRYLSDS